MKTRPVASRDVPSTPHFDFIYGKYSLSRWRIPYFSAAMSLDEAANSLQLVSEFPGWHHMDWSLEELYQRDLNWPRVEGEIVPYLRKDEEAQFFNALTIALLPLQERELKDDYRGEEWNAPGVISDEELISETVDVGPISFGYYEEWDDVDDPGAKLGKIRWNPDQVFSVAIDGQHRLAAIKQRAQELEGSSQVKATRVPVILLVFDRRIGFKSPGDSTLGIIGLLRKLFIDLNKNAEPVSRTREILLDDRDPHSLCIRSLVGDRLTSDLDDLEKSPPSLPLSLVDWHTDSAKFDDGPYLCTVLGLDWIISKLLGSEPVSDLMDYSAVSRQISAFRDALGIGLEDAKERVAELSESANRPFYYTSQTTSGDSDELGLIQEAFRKVWNRAIIRLLTQFRPYRSFIEERKDCESFSDEFISWFYLYERQRNDRPGGRATRDYEQFISKLELGPEVERRVTERELESTLERLKEFKNGNLAFTVVFQRALILATVEALKVEEHHLDEVGQQVDAEEVNVLSGGVGDDEKNWENGGSSEVRIEDETWTSLARFNERRISQVVSALNDFEANNAGFLEKYFRYGEEGQEASFWIGTLLRPEGTIDFTKAASRRSRELVYWIISLWLSRQVGDGSECDTFEEYWDKVKDSSAPYHNRLERSVRRYYSGESSAAARIVESREEEYDEEIGRKEALDRLRWLWGRIQREGSGG